MHAYVQITLDHAKEDDILETLKAMDEVTEAYILFGTWDMIAKIKLEGPEQLATFVIDKIRGIPGIKMTATSIVAK